MDQKIYEMDEYEVEYKKGQNDALCAIKTMLILMRAGRLMAEVMNDIFDVPDYLKLMLYEYLEGYLQREREDGQNN